MTSDLDSVLFRFGATGSEAESDLRFVTVIQPSISGRKKCDPYERLIVSAKKKYEI